VTVSQPRLDAIARHGGGARSGQNELRDLYGARDARHGVLLRHPKMTSAANPGAVGARRRRRPARALCGARTRSDGACLVRTEAGKARCRFHGGLSTGPKTEAGRERISEAQRRRWLAYREKLGATIVIGDDIVAPTNQAASSNATPGGSTPVTS